MVSPGYSHFPALSPLCSGMPWVLLSSLDTSFNGIYSLCTHCIIPEIFVFLSILPLEVRGRLRASSLAASQPHISRLHHAPSSYADAQAQKLFQRRSASVCH